MAKKSARTVNLSAALSKMAKALGSASKTTADLAREFESGRAKCYRDGKVTKKTKKR